MIVIDMILKKGVCLVRLQKQCLRNKTSVITRTRTSTDILFCDKTPVPMFYFDSKTARPIVPL